ncbi:MAG TPA: hypothetical protein VNS34_09240 [Rhizobiaceae bacterium]|nr:hypothetical protein [Rhizobiaceae bacterium]
MGSVRPLIRSDVPAVAVMLQRILRKTSDPVTPSLEVYLEDLFLNGAHHDADINSHVYVRDDGAVAGFIGALAFPMDIGGRAVRGALCGTFMVDRHSDDPFAGARLMRAFLAGPQDISLTETANDISTTMWRGINATMLPAYSLEWLRVLRPAEFLIEIAAHACRAARMISPLARPLDRLLRQRNIQSRYFGLPGKALPTREADDEMAAALLERFTSSFAARPQWKAENLRCVIAESRRKALYGEMVRRVVTTRDGRAVGLFQYYGDPNRIGRVIQTLAAPGQSGAVIDSMIAHASDRGLVALRGRTMPALIDAMLGQPFLFMNAASSIVHARDQTLVEPFRTGKAFFNGFAGESWSRLIGDRFD